MKYGQLAFFWKYFILWSLQMPKSYISSKFIKFLTTEVFYSTNSILEILFFIISYSMYVSLKDLCLVIYGCFREPRKSPCGKSLLRVQTLTSRFGISTVFIDTVTLCCFNMYWHRIVIYDVQEMYILHWK